VFAALWSISIRRLYLTESAAAPAPEPVDWKKRLLLLVAWCCISFVLSLPTILYALGSGLPPETNTLGLSQTTLTISHHFTGSLVYFVSAMFIPTLATTMVKLVHSGSSKAAQAPIAGRLMMFARLVVVVLAPGLTMFLTNHQCLGKWLLLWSPCVSNIESYNTIVNAPVTYNYAYLEEGKRHIHAVRIPAIFEVTVHDDVCIPEYIADGRCPRAMFEMLGLLYVNKLAMAVTVAPLLNLLLGMPFAIRAREWVIRNVLCYRSYVATKSLSREVAGVVMMLELPIIVGVAVPIVVPLACLATALNACMFHSAVKHFGIKLEEQVKASTRYLWFSSLLGYALYAWLFMENDLNGKWLMLLGMPGCALLVLAVPWRFISPQHTPDHELVVEQASLYGPLLEEGSGYVELT